MKTLIAALALLFASPALACDYTQLSYPAYAEFAAKWQTPGPKAVCSVDSSGMMYCKYPSGLWHVLYLYPTTNVSLNGQMWERDVNGKWNMNYGTVTCSCDRLARTGLACKFSR